MASRQRSDSQAEHPSAPPRAPWVPLHAADPPTGYLCFYYSDDLSSLPVRHVTRPGDCKSDPNLETATFGVFSTCEPNVRTAMVNHEARYLFFVTRRPGVGRVLAGYYRIGWWCGESRGSARDVRLTADEVHFVSVPIPLDDLPRPVRDDATRPMRNCRPVDARKIQQLLDVLRASPDATTDYVEEIHRLERFNASHAGTLYPGWGQTVPFSWDVAYDFLDDLKGGGPPGSAKNQSDSRLWQCPACGEIRRNRSRLRRCPACKAVVTLEAVTES